jgi:steroid delta-isomerase-like uncharacterized protein
MTAEQIVQRYFDGWNAHDTSMIQSTFVNGGTYADPTTKGPLEGDAIGQNAAGLWAAFPDVKFEVRSHVASEGRFSAEWVMTGTNLGSFAGLPPSGRKVVLNGADFIQVSDKGIRSVQGYFDPGEMPRQLGLQIVVQPNEAGPFAFGTSVRIAGPVSKKPGAFSITSLIARHANDVQRVQNYSQQIAMELPRMKGFLGWLAGTIGERMVTITAWENPDDSRQLMTGGLHVEASRAFHGPDLAAGGWTGVFTAHRMNPVLSRCPACGTMVRRVEDSRRCNCGADLGETPVYW